MGILLILAQVTLVLLDLAAHVITLNLWLVFLPAVLFGTIWLLAVVLGCTLVIDRINPFAARSRR